MTTTVREPTAWDLTRAIMRERYRRSFVLPNYTPHAWWECDVFEVTAAGYFVEYEVKISISDFKADAKKGESSHWGWDDQAHFGRGGLTRKSGETTKHRLLTERSIRGPSRFYFVTPVGLVATEPREGLDPAAVLPEWAGLIEVEDRGHWWCPKIVRQAPRLHRQKLGKGVAEHARGVCYYRMHGAF